MPSPRTAARYPPFINIHLLCANKDSNIHRNSKLIVSNVYRNSNINFRNIKNAFKIRISLVIKHNLNNYTSTTAAYSNHIVKQ
jgi:hypothetical protein